MRRIILPELGELERKVLVALSQRTDNSRLEGSKISGITEIIYGNENPSQHYETTYKVLERVWRKGLVKKYEPVCKKNLWKLKVLDYSYGRFSEYNLEGETPASTAKELALDTFLGGDFEKYWWILTEEGKNLANHLTRREEVF